MTRPPTLKRCESGKHHYDPSKFSSCPHCVRTRMTIPRVQDVQPAAAVPAGGLDKTTIKAPAPDVATVRRAAPPLDPAATRVIDPSAPLDTAALSRDSSAAVDGQNVESAPGKSAPEQPALDQQNRFDRSKSRIEGLPTVGWLLVVGGKDAEWEKRFLGRDFALVPGSNRIGQGADVEVGLDLQDPKVSDDCHCILTYDPESNRFFLQKGPGRNLTHVMDPSTEVTLTDKSSADRGSAERGSASEGSPAEKVNDEAGKTSKWQVILAPTELAADSIIRVGDIKLRFIPLCGSDFQWSFLTDDE